MGTFTFSRAYVFPVRDEITANQLTSYSLGGAAGATGRRVMRVYDLGGYEVTKQLIFRDLPKTEVESLLSWLQDGTISWRRNTFTFTDVFGVAFTVRLMNELFALVEESYQQIATLSLTLRIEA